MTPGIILFLQRPWILESARNTVEAYNAAQQALTAAQLEAQQAHLYGAQHFSHDADQLPHQVVHHEELQLHLGRLSIDTQPPALADSRSVSHSSSRSPFSSRSISPSSSISGSP